MIKCLLTEFRSRRTGKYLALGHGARSVRHDLGPNIFQSGPPTQSISTYSSPVILLNRSQKTRFYSVLSRAVNHRTSNVYQAKHAYAMPTLAYFPQKAMAHLEVSSLRLTQVPVRSETCVR